MAVGSKILGVKNMSSGTEIAKLLASGESLSPQQEQQVADFLNPVQTLGGWIKLGSSNPSFRHFETETGHFNFMPLQMAQFKLAGTQSINNDTETALQFDEATLNDSAFKWTSGDPTKIISASPDPTKFYMFGGAVQFDNDADGYRAVFINQFDSSDVLIGGDTISQLAPPPDIGSAIPFGYATKVFSNFNYFTITVRHTAGAALDITFVRVGLFRVF